MPDTVTSLLVQINMGRLLEHGRPCLDVVPMFAITNGSGTYTLGSIPFINDQPVSLTNPLPVIVNASSLTYEVVQNATIGAISNVLFVPGDYDEIVTIQTQPGSDGNIWLGLGITAEVNSGPIVFAGGGSIKFGTQENPMPTGTVYAISDSGTQIISIWGG